jgi:DNA-binding beta-propeller fold protein YncE
VELKSTAAAKADRRRISDHKFTVFPIEKFSMYTIDATTGALTSMGTIAAGTDPVSVAVDPSGKFAYVTNSGSNDVSMYSIGSTGTLTLIATIGT